MTRFGLFAVPLVFVAGFIPTVVRAQQLPNGPLGATAPDAAPAASSASPAPAKMTARERAEMNAEILMARKEFDDAAKAYQTILIDDPHNSKILNSAGIAFQELGDGVKA